MLRAGFGIALGAFLSVTIAQAQTPARVSEALQATAQRELPRYFLEWYAALHLNRVVLPEIRRERLLAQIRALTFEVVPQDDAPVACREDSVAEPGGGRLYFRGPFCFVRRPSRVRIGRRTLEEAIRNPREARVLTGWILLRLNGREGLTAPQVRALVNELWGDFSNRPTPVDSATEAADLEIHTTYENASVQRVYLSRWVAGGGEVEGPSLGRWFDRSEMNGDSYSDVRYRLRAGARVGVGAGAHYSQGAEGGEAVMPVGGGAVVAHGMASMRVGPGQPIWEPAASLDIRAAIEAGADRPLYTLQLNLGSSAMPYGLAGLWVGLDANQFRDLSERIARVGLSVEAAPIDFGGGDYLMIHLGAGMSVMEAEANGRRLGGEYFDSSGWGADLSAILRAGRFFVLLRGRYDRYASASGLSWGEPLQRLGASGSISIPIGALFDRNSSHGMRIEGDLVHYFGATQRFYGDVAPETRISILTGTARLLYEVAF